MNYKLFWTARLDKHRLLCQFVLLVMNWIICFQRWHVKAMLEHLQINNKCNLPALSMKDKIWKTWIDQVSFTQTISSLIWTHLFLFSTDKYKLCTPIISKLATVYGSDFILSKSVIAPPWFKNSLWIISCSELQGWINIGCYVNLYCWLWIE